MDPLFVSAELLDSSMFAGERHWRAGVTPFKSGAVGELHPKVGHRITLGVFFMAKYGEQFKLKLVNIEPELVVCGRSRGVWRRLYGVAPLDSRLEQHGREGLGKKYSHYDAQFRMSVLSHMWREKVSCQQATAVFDIRAQDAIAKREHRYHAGGIDALAPRPRGRHRK
ncbi:helix-turn-helix domain-containing protein [Caballeronia sp. AZ10_KS36]|uniref:helix-turn-helix domain-containing protein n=1 Tax=Caballeronia sp. AZ10_KS36 TaxID=2921757 RepID=UPI002027E16A|nr:helix-turn-helix domain-containing protein [Caballeronia sp. AZ10_KS36]